MKLELQKDCCVGEGGKRWYLYAGDCGLVEGWKWWDL